MPVGKFKPETKIPRSRPVDENRRTVPFPEFETYRLPLTSNARPLTLLRPVDAKTPKSAPVDENRRTVLLAKLPTKRSGPRNANEEGLLNNVVANTLTFPDVSTELTELVFWSVTNSEARQTHGSPRSSATTNAGNDNEKINFI
jgi:hypothetical protein